MSEISVKIEDVVGHHITPEQVKRVVEVVENFVRIGKGIAKYTPITWDDEAIVIAEGVLAFVKPISLEPWFVDFVDFVVHLFKKEEDPRVVFDKLKAAIAFLG